MGTATEPASSPSPPYGRRPLPKRRRTIYAVVLGAAFATTVVAAVLASVFSETPTPQIVSLPAKYRNASPELIREAERVGFYPRTGPGAGDLVTAPASNARPSSNDDLLPVGSQAPAFALRTPTGARVRLADFRGKTTLIEFFATWCPHCSAEAPHLRRLALSLPRSRYAFVSIDASSGDAPSVLAYDVYFRLPFPALLDPGAEAGSFNEPESPGPVSASYGVKAYPTFYVLDAEGRITWRSDGEQPIALLRRELLRAAAG
jgi:thiol-disulfide isomerase/thioredoxin